MNFKLNRRRFLLSSAALAAAPALTLEAQRPTAPPSSGPLPPAVAALKNRKSEVVPITLTERQQRFERARELMHQQKMSAICITGGTSLVYFTGIRWGQSERLFAFILPATGAPFIVCPVFEEDRVRERLTSVPDGATTKIYTWNEDEDPYALTAKALREAGISTGSLGMEERVQFVFADRIAQACPGLKITSAIPLVFGCRSIKSSAELALMRLANAITFSVYEAVYKSAGPGTTTRQFSELVSAAYMHCGVQGDASCQVGEYSALPHGSIQPQVIREGEIVLIDDGCTVEGYQSDMSRSFVYGKPTDKQRKVFDIVHKAQSAALAAARPGVECQAIDAAARGVVTAAGFGPDYAHFSHRVGHGIGMDGHEWPYLVRGNTQPLAVGMTFSDEPGVYIKGEFGIRLEDDWVVTPTGAEMFTPQSPSLEDPFGKA
jgi:Xaa-Pro dipeptidase